MKMSQNEKSDFEIIRFKNLTHDVSKILGIKFDVGDKSTRSRRSNALTTFLIANNIKYKTSFCIESYQALS